MRAKVADLTRRASFLSGQMKQESLATRAVIVPDKVHDTNDPSVQQIQAKLVICIQPFSSEKLLDGTLQFGQFPHISNTALSASGLRDLLALTSVLALLG
jgi:hypothetical protein